MNQEPNMNTHSDKDSLTQTEENVLYAARTPMGVGLVAALIGIFFDIALVFFTMDCLVEQIQGQMMLGKMLALFFLLFLELFLLFFLVNLFAWRAFGQEEISIRSGEQIVKRKYRLLGKIRSVNLSDIKTVEIETPEDAVSGLLSSFAMLRYMLRKGNIVVTNFDGTRFRLCMSKDVNVLESVADTIQNSL